jgi:hypothetical protein
VELVDTPDLGSGAERCGGSSPPSRTMQSVGITGFANTKSQCCTLCCTFL